MTSVCVASAFHLWVSLRLALSKPDIKGVLPYIHCYSIFFFSWTAFYFIYVKSLVDRTWNLLCL